MRILNGTIKRFAKLGLLLMMGMSMNGCSNTMEWEEAVKLHDGQIIVAKRFYNLGGKPTWESRERAALDETVTFNLPGTGKKITWKNDFRDSVPEPNSLNLIRFDVVKGVPYIATYPAGCIAYNKWGRPNPPQVLFEYTNDQWQRISLAEYPAELINTQANVVVGRPATKLLKSFYTVEGVNEENREIDTPEYRRILQKPVTAQRTKELNQWCGEMVYDGKGGWIGIGWFSEQPSKKTCLNYCDREKITSQYCPCETLFKGAK